MTTKKVPIDGDLLKPIDFRRARVMLGGRDPWELYRGHQEDRTVLIAWCLLSRDNPDLTWDEVDSQTFGEFVEVPDDWGTDDEEGAETPPTPGPATSSSSEPGTNGNAESKRKRNTAAPEPNSSSSSG